MKVCRWLVLAALTTACGTTDAQDTPTDRALQEGERKTSTDPAVNPDAAAMASFKERVDAYAELNQKLAKGEAKLKETADPATIGHAKAELAAKIQAARAGVKHGAIFTSEIRPVFRRLLAPELKGAEGRDVKDVLKDDAPAPGTIPFRVNATYPEDQPLPTVPANLLLTLPPLPAPLEYRIVGQHLLLLDTSSDLVVDYILNAITT
jgi:hypothetical protein